MLYGLNAGYNLTDRFALEGLLHYVHAKSNNAASETNETLNYRLEVLYHLFPKDSFVPFLAAGYGGISTHTKNHGSYGSGVLSYGLGAKYFMTDDIALRADLRHLVIDPGASVFADPAHVHRTTIYNYEYTLGLNFQFGGDRPAPPAAPAPAPKKVEPPPPAPKKVEPPPAPVPPPPAPVPPPPAAPVISLKSAPATVDKGASSALSWSAENTTECSLQPGLGNVQSGSSKQSSGILSVTPAETTTYKLACKGPGGSAESFASVHVNQPPPPAPVVECKSMTLHLGFDTAKDAVKTFNKAEVDEFLAKVAKFPKATVLFEGHTDSVGGAAMNQKLSERRAANVKKYIMEKHGVDGSRITTKGFGLSKPVDTNKTAEGRANNRRVEAIFNCP